MEVSGVSTDEDEMSPIDISVVGGEMLSMDLVAAAPLLLARL